MIKKIIIGVFVAFVALLALVKIVGGMSYPDYSNYVNDFAKVLSQNFVDSTNQRLLKYDQETTNQIVVLTVQTTQPETIEEYSIHVADKWKPGQKGKDNGVLMTFAMDDRKMRIEVGRGLEGDLTDIESKHIIDDIITPEFKQKQYEGGISKGIDAVQLAIATESAITTGASGDPSAGVIVLIVFIIIVVILLLIAASPWTPLGGEGTWGITSGWSSSSGSSDGGGSGFGGFGGGSFSGGGSSRSW